MRQPFVPPILLFPASGPQPEPGPRPCALPAHTSAGGCVALAPYARRRRTGAVPCIVWGLILFVLFNPVGSPLALAGAFLGVRARADSCPEASRPRLVAVAAVLCGLAAVADVTTALFFLLPR